MSQPPDPDYQKAKKRVKEKKAFFQHLTTYLVMSLFFFLLNATTSFGHWWFYWPILGWGIGIVFHYFEIFGWPGAGPASKEWEEEEIRRELDKMRKKQSTGEKQEPSPADEPLDLRELDPRRQWRDDELV